MASQLTKEIRREVYLNDITSPVVVSVDPNAGIHLFIKGSRYQLWCPWDVLIKNSYTPSKVPSYLMDKPMEMLKHYDNMKQKKEA